MFLHCVRTACTCRETHPRSRTTYLLAWQSSKAQKDDNETAFKLVLQRTYEQNHSALLSTTMQWYARCTHVQVASATLRYITKTVATQMATNIVILFLLFKGCLLLCPHRLRHMRPRSIGLIPTNTKLSKVEQNAHMAMQLHCRACPHMADNLPLPQACKEVLPLVR